MVNKVVEHKTYDSNPFTLAFNAFIKFFNTNVGWAIAVLVMGIFGFIGQMISNVAQVAMTPESTTTTSSSSDVITSSGAASDTNVAAIAMIVVGVVIILLFVIAIASAVSTYISGMLSYVALQSEKGKSVGFSEAWEATSKRFWRLYLASLLAGLKIFGWTLLFIIPGIIASLRYKLLPYVIMADSQTSGVGSSHESTKQIVKGRLMEVFGVATVASIVPFVGSLVGLTGNAALFSQLKTYDDANLEKPKVHWLNYLGLILIGILVLFLMMIGLIIFAAAIASNS